MSVASADKLPARPAAGRRAIVRRRFTRDHVSRLLGLLGIAAVLVGWQLSTDLGLVDPLFASSPSRVASAYRTLIDNGELWRDVRSSALVFVIGLAAASVVGIAVGVLMGWYRPLHALFNPFVGFFNAIPRVALIPLFFIWLGIGTDEKAAVVFMGATFPILINTLNGIKSLDVSVIRAARSFGASDLQVFRTVVLPGTVPFIVAGLRIGLAMALTGTVVAEMYASSTGIGYLIVSSGNMFKIDDVFVGVTFVAAVGVILTALLHRLERRFDTWRPRRS
jgi:NitT/TauT family transport system permease protein